MLILLSSREMEIIEAPSNTIFNGSFCKTMYHLLQIVPICSHLLHCCYSYIASYTSVSETCKQTVIHSKQYETNFSD